MFDGYCRFCSGSVNLVLDLDRAGGLRFMPIQSDYGRALALEHGLDPEDPTTFVFFDRGRPLEKSTGALAVAERLGTPWRWAGVLHILPRVVRDGIYDLVARNRYRWFGRREQCRLPRPGEAARFVMTQPPAGAAGP